MVKLFPEKACCCSLTVGLNTLLTTALILRLGGIVCGCFYGPYLYLVVSIGGLYLLGDFMLLWSLNRRTSEGKFMCDFTSQKVWIISWQILNIIGIIGLSVAIGWYLLSLGFWSMEYEPIHLAVFLIIVLLIPVLIATSYILHGLYLMLGEAYIDFMLSRGRPDSYYDEDEEPLDFRRISV